METLTVRLIKLHDARLLEKNPKMHDLGAVMESIQKYGFKDPPKWEPALNDGEGGIVEGNGRTEALLEMWEAEMVPPRGIVEDSDTLIDDRPEWMIPVLFGVDAADEFEALSYSLDHNILTMKGGDFELSDIVRMYDRDEFVDIATLLADRGQLPVSIDGDDVDYLKLLRDKEPKKGEGEGTGGERDKPEIETRVRTGEIWQVGSQAVICGDCRDPKVWHQFFQGKVDRPIDLAITSPPYAEQRKYDEESEFKPIPPEQYVDWFEPVQQNIKSYLALDGSFFLNIKEHSEDRLRSLYVKDLLIAHVRKWGWKWIDEFVWIHNGIPGSPEKMGKFKNQFEPIFWLAQRPDPRFHPDAVMHKSEYAVLVSPKNEGAKDLQGKGGMMTGEITGEGLAYPGNVLKLGRNNDCEDTGGHSAVFPIELPEFFIQAYSKPGDLVFDPFGGAGTTLVACHNHDREGAAIEISPKNCEIILRRLEKRIGREAERIN